MLVQNSLVKFTSVFLFFSALILLAKCSASNTCDDGSCEAPIVQLPNGKIRGLFKNGLYEFKGIPYAEPPVGENRFEPPKTYKEKWEGIRDGTKMPSKCLQWDQTKFSEDLLNGNEDCLYLNVYSPSITVSESSKLYPVVVFIHGGAFMFGSGAYMRPERLLKTTKFVFVTINYRLGPLGFLSTGDNQISGNMGLKDQQLALRWIKMNIRLFNGDPNRILITGFSAGGASVHFQLLSQGSKGLFSAAISHSGTVFCAWVHVRNPLERARKLSSYLKCPTANTTELKNCLKAKDPKDIVRAVKHFQPFHYNPFMVFGPVIESKIENPNTFISDEFESVIKEGQVSLAPIPWIVSFTTEEGGYNAGTLLDIDEETGEEYIENFDNKWDKLAPLMLFYNETVPGEQHKLYAENIKSRYLKGEKFSKKTYRKVQKMFSEQLYLNGIEKSVRLHRDYTDSPVYVYRYGRELRSGKNKIIVAKRDDYNFGAVHGSEIFLIHENGFISSESFNEEEWTICGHFAKMFESLVKTGIPHYGGIKIEKNIPRSDAILFLDVINGYKYEVKSVDTLLDKKYL